MFQLGVVLGFCPRFIASHAPLPRGSAIASRGKPSSVLFSVDLELLPGQLVLAAGDTGSGRSTLAHLLHLDLTASAGSVQVGADWGRVPHGLQVEDKAVSCKD